MKPPKRKKAKKRVIGYVGIVLGRTSTMAIFYQGMCERPKHKPRKMTVKKRIANAVLMEKL